MIFLCVWRFHNDQYDQNGHIGRDTKQRRDRSRHKIIYHSLKGPDKAKDQRIDTGLFRIFPSAVNGTQADKAAICGHIDGVHTQLLHAEIQPSQGTGHRGNEQADQLDSICLDSHRLGRLYILAGYTDIDTEFCLIHDQNQRSHNEKCHIGNARLAIENAASDKVAYCASYGVTITEEEWPCHHIPTAILADRGEMESRSADNLVQMLGIRIENAPPYRADLKGIIEQHFRTINTDATPFLPGKVLPDMSERGGHDYRLDAKLDIRQFTEIIIRCVLYYNNSHYMDYFENP